MMRIRSTTKEDITRGERFELNTTNERGGSGGGREAKKHKIRK
jgi:hypothetical protein